MKGAMYAAPFIHHGCMKGAVYIAPLIRNGCMKGAMYIAEGPNQPLRGQGCSTVREQRFWFPRAGEPCRYQRMTLQHSADPEAPRAQGGAVHCPDFCPHVHGMRYGLTYLSISHHKLCPYFCPHGCGQKYGQSFGGHMDT